jgi:HPr kinase/phosphorylase
LARKAKRYRGVWALEEKQGLVSRMFCDCGEDLGLRLLTQGCGLEIAIGQADIVSPGLALAGFDQGLPPGQIQVIGRAEVLYLSGLERQAAGKAFGALLAAKPPCVIVAQAMDLPGALVDLASGKGVAVFATALSPAETIRYLSNYLQVELAPETSINGTLVDVYGIGILIRGRSGTGKSECALELVERGHRLVADDLVRVVAGPSGTLMGRSVEPLQSYVEVRGIGLVDIGSIYGIRALRRQKRIEIEVNLREWGEEGVSFDRSGLESKQSEILGVKIPSMTVPLVAGKNISVIVEVIALSHVLGVYGYDAADSLRQKLAERLKRAGRTGFVARDTE